jgi:hypothetical protein
MGQDQCRRKSRTLWVLILLALAYSVLLGCQYVSTGTATLDGAIGVMLGLYVCSHPAANAVDSLLFGRGVPQVSSKPLDVLWLVLNLLALLTGWLVIFIGAMRFTANIAVISNQ